MFATASAEPKKREGQRRETAPSATVSEGSHNAAWTMLALGMRTGQTTSDFAGDDSASPLETGVRDRVEPVLGADLGGVRVHGGPRARHTASALSARAFTLGNHIYLGPGAHASDLSLMAHEAAHTVQQTAPGVIHRDATNQSIAPSYATALNDGDLLYETQLVEQALTSVKADDPTHQTLTENLTVLRNEASMRHPGADVVSDEPLGPVRPPSVAQIPQGGTDVGKIGVVDWDGDPQLRLRSSPETTDDSNIITGLEFSTLVQVIKSFPVDWYFVSTPTGDMGYCSSQYVRTDLPEPNARRHRVASGTPGTAIAIAEHYYGQYADNWGQDLRFYVAVLAWANKISIPDHYWGWKQVHFQAGQKIWVPSQRFAYSLRGSVNSGSLSYNALDTIGLAGFIERIAELWDDFNKALDYSDQFKAKAMQVRIEQAAIGLVEGLISMIKMAVAILAISTAIGALIGAFAGGVGAAPGAAAGFEVGMVILEWLGLGMLVMWIGEALIQLGEAFGSFLSMVWNARGDDKKLQQAGYLWADAIALMIAKILEGLLMLVMAKGLPKGFEALRGTRLGRAMGETEAMKWLGERSAKVKSGESPIPGPGAVLDRVMGTGKVDAQPANVTARGNAAAFHQLPPSRLPANLPEGHFWMRSADGTQWVLMREAGTPPTAFELSVYADAANVNYNLRAGGRLIQTDTITRTDAGYSGNQRLPEGLRDTGANNPYNDPVTGQPWDKGHGTDFVDTREGPGTTNSTLDPANFTPQASWWNQGPRNALVGRIRNGHAPSGRLGGGGYREMGIYDPNPPMTANGTPIPREFIFVETDAAGVPQRAWRIANQQGAAGRTIDVIDSMTIPLSDVPPVMRGPGSALAGTGGGSTTYAPGMIFGMRGDREEQNKLDAPALPATAGEMCVDKQMSVDEPLVCQ